MRKTKKRRRGSGTAGIMIIVLAFLVSEEKIDGETHGARPPEN